MRVQRADAMRVEGVRAGRCRVWYGKKITHRNHGRRVLHGEPAEPACVRVTVRVRVRLGLVRLGTRQ